MFRRLHLLAFSFIFNAELFFLVELSIRLKKRKKAVKRELNVGAALLQAQSHTSTLVLQLCRVGP